MKHTLTIIALLLAQSLAHAAGAESHAAMNVKHKALLQDFCVKCHGAEKQKGKFRVSDLPFDITNLETAEKWQKILNAMNSGEMPPDEEKQPRLHIAARRPYPHCREEAHFRAI